MFGRPFGSIAITTVIALLSCSETPQKLDANLMSDRTPAEDNTPAPTDPGVATNSGTKPNAFYYFSLGEQNLEENNLDLAIENFKMAVIHDPESAESYFHLAEAYTRKQMFPEAITAIQMSIKLDPEESNAYVVLGGIYSASRMFDDAIKAYKKAIELDPTNHEAKFVAAMIYAEQEKWTESEDLLKGILTTEPNHYFAVYYLGKIYEIQNKDAQATVFYKHAVELRPGLTPAARALSVMYEKSANYYGLIDLYSAILREEPSNPVVIKKIAQTYLVVDQFEQSRQFFKKYLELEKDDINARITYGLIQLELKDHKGAHTTFKDILAQYPNSDKVRFYLGMTYEAQEKSNDAVENFLLVTQDSEHFVSAMAHVTFHLKTKEPKRALDVLDKAIKLQPQTVAFYDLKAQVYEENLNYSQSEAELQKGLAINPSDESILYYLGTIQQKMGNSSEAISTMERILKLNENNFNALNFIGYTYADQGKKLGDAEKLVEKALKFKPEDPFIMDSLGWVFYKQGHYDKAVKQLQKALEKRPEESIILSHLGEVYLKMNMPNKARDAFQRALVHVKEAAERNRIQKLLGSSEIGGDFDATRNPSADPSSK